MHHELFLSLPLDLLRDAKDGGGGGDEIRTQILRGKYTLEWSGVLRNLNRRMTSSKCNRLAHLSNSKPAAFYYRGRREKRGTRTAHVPNVPCSRPETAPFCLIKGTRRGRGNDSIHLQSLQWSSETQTLCKERGERIERKSGRKGRNNSLSHSLIFFLHGEQLSFLGKGTWDRAGSGSLLFLRV